MDDPRNTDNAWLETVAISVHFEDQNDVEMKRMNSVTDIMAHFIKRVYHDSRVCNESAR